MTAGGARGFVALTRACAAWPAAAVWVALALAPAFAVPQAYRLFEENKVLLTRILVVPACAVALALRARWKPLGIAGLGLATWLVASLVAAFASTSSALALPGDYVRQDGWLTDVALAGAFLGAFACGRDRGQRGLTLDLILAAGVVSAFVAVLGYTPWRPFFVDVEGTRASGLAGGPTYFGTAMAALVPLALAQRERRGFGAFALVAFLGVLASGSRLALLAASLGAAYVLLQEPRERRARPLLVGGLLVLAIGALSLSPWKSALPPDLMPTRLADLTRPSELGTRVDLYAEAIAAIAATPARLAFGHGPDTIGVEFTRGISEALQTAIGATTRVDRFHSELLDVVFTRGVFAALGLIVLVVGAWRAGRKFADDATERALRGLVLVLT
ncbi:MAG: O-antigen ligase family protein, partial [Planctomycetes bacterium]|nr:O-antigen ligase family protein [Planctomycetota bacterium]